MRELNATRHVEQEKLRNGEVTEKQCSKCDQTKHMDEFGSWDDPRTGLRRWQVVCKSCHNAANRQRNRAKKNAPPVSDFCDAGCGRALIKGGKAKNSANLDHDPVTGKFRGWLCSNCNKGMGLLGDDLAGILKAAEYLRRTTST